MAEAITAVRIRCRCGRPLFTRPQSGYVGRWPGEIPGGAPGERFTYACHPKRCGRTYTIKAETLRAMAAAAIAAGQDTIWL